ncbi:ATP-dependent DNA helicase RecG [Bifidobacterium sp.]|uniref:ATP-dependent DNA helicase RecG n=1 Tax=Bifidobacterium sp. TaxID=41200 RepID=UPI0025C459BA|nr:ATP-dependent DNA helicase RecG [Bifidobacterium sp.]MCH4208929.1 ATP-dependent DNA helicase RecG [Bifidobacterium sp.]MCI1224476.1 ATP-dependent DNA helicase RecG [Bifidobacterium sp.]
MSVSLGTPISSLMTNKRRVSALKSLGLVTVGDALTYYPFRVSDPVAPRALREAYPGQPMAFAAQVRQVRVVPMNARRGFRLEAIVDDADFARTRNIGGAIARLVFFSGKRQYIDWLSARMHSGVDVVVAGEPTEFNGQLQFTHPEVLTIDPDPSGSADSGSAGPTGAGTSRHMVDADSEEEALRRVCRPRPIYHATSRISSEHIHESVLGFLDLLRRDDAAESGDTAADASQLADIDTVESAASAAAVLRQAIPDIVPESIRSARGLMHRAQAFLAIHDPQSTEEFHQAIAAMRYEEALVSQVSVLQSRQHARRTQARACIEDSLRDMFIASLPFKLTGGQREVIDDIAADMAQNYPMQRLLQGEVGSGKTVVAVSAMLQAVGAGYQAVLVAPTQVLAEQHYRTISAMTNGDSMRVVMTLLTGGMKLSARRKALARAASGEPGIIVATHAAFSSTFQAPNLALVVIDEQHRFGVEQRESLRSRSDTTPHLLVMTATPIPRTAAMTWFGDLDISWLTELPGGRKPITTVVVPEADARTMAAMFTHVRGRIDAGERAYVVCPRIDMDEDADDADGPGEDGFEAFDDGLGDERAQNAAVGRLRAGSGRGGAGSRRSTGPGGSEDIEPKPPLHAVAEIAQRLQSLPQFEGIAFATLTGRDDDATKAQVMADFTAGKTPVLVATTVIEVGVDVPQASCIVIFDADRYGLSQLHQLRGRVGRGGTDSWAFLVSRAEPDSIAAQRLEVIHHSLDGAEIAQADLELRGAGDVLGDAQSGGKSGLKLLRVVKDAAIIRDARADADALLDSDPDLSHAVQLAGAVLDFTRGGESQIVSS